jgi:hypothetical protein
MGENDSTSPRGTLDCFEERKKEVSAVEMRLRLVRSFTHSDILGWVGISLVRPLHTR